MCSNGRLAGKVAIVTGAREGIGRAVALALAREGARVVAASRSIGEDSEVVREVQALGSDVLPVRVDVASRADTRRMVEVSLNHFGQVDILVNNAGLSRPAMLHKMTEEQWDEVLAVNLKGAFNCLQAVVGHMMERGRGSIVNVTSAAGQVGTIGQINYSAAKAGILGLTKSAARELARYNINVNAIAPFAETRMTETIATDPRFREKYLARIPMGRFGKPEEIAPAVVFLVSDEARYITGQVLGVDGGLVMGG